MKKYQVEVEYILDQIEPEAIVAYIAEKPHAVESLLSAIDAEVALEYLIKNMGGADVACQIIMSEGSCNEELLNMMDFDDIEGFYLENK